jgi:hypothetical protein
MRYRVSLYNVIGRHWLSLTKKKADLVAIGTVSVTARIRSDGQFSNVRVLSNTANETSANIVIATLKENRFPPMPEEIRLLTGGSLECDLDFTVNPR